MAKVMSGGAFKRGLAAASVLACLWIGGVRADEPQIPASLRGKLVISDVLIAPSSEFGATQLMRAARRRRQRSVVDGKDGFWRLHLVAFLDRDRDPPDSAALDTGTLRIVATDVTDPKDLRQVKVFEVTAAPGAR